MVRIFPAPHSFRLLDPGKDVTTGKWQPSLKLRPCCLILPFIPHPDFREGFSKAFIIILALSGKVSAFGLLDDVRSDLIDLKCLHILEDVKVLRPKTHELIESLAVFLLP